jgi:vanillate O-demethylase ferredoxin subunit
MAADVAAETIDQAASSVSRASTHVSSVMQLMVKAAIFETPNIFSYDLRAPSAGELPPFTAGAHIDLMLPNGLTRSYSLLNDQAERHRYVIGVQNDLNSRGGSRWIHEHLRPGNVISVTAPRNNFALDESAEKSVFIAGGIGITPILSMVSRLGSLNRHWELFYCARTRVDAAFLDRIDKSAKLNFDGEPGGRMLDIPAVVAAAGPDAHLYCCGPESMLAAFEAATAQLPRHQVHVERFRSTEAAATEGGFTIVLAQSGKEIFVSAGKTILDAVLEAGIDFPYSCTEGVCGTCEVAVLEGIPDHRDMILTEREHAANRSMMICCSGSKSSRLVLDI